MSTEVSIFRDQSVMTMGEGDGIDDVTKRLMGGNTYRRISIAGGKFRMIINGQEVARNNSDAMDIVVVNAAPHVSRTFYGKTYDPKNIGLPDCWSNDGIKPDAKAPAPQGSACEACPKNASGSGVNGSKACRYSQRLAVVLGNDIEHSDVYQLSVPATSLFGKGEGTKLPLGAYVKQLSGFKHSITGVITEIKFDETVVNGQRITFRPVRALNAEEKAAVKEKGDSQDALNAIDFNPAQMDGADKPVSEAAAEESTIWREEPAAPATEDTAPEPYIRGKGAAKPTAKTTDELISEWAQD